MSFEKFFEEFGEYVFVGIELEFYLVNSAGDSVSEFVIGEFFAKFRSKFFEQDELSNVIIESERGYGQIEIKTDKYCDMQKLVTNFYRIKNLCNAIAKDLGVIINDNARPFLNDCPNALQFNLSVWENGRNLIWNYDKNCFDIEFASKIANSMLEFLDESMFLFVGNEEDYKRFDLKYNKNLAKIGKFTAPVNKSWGVNNRTTAIRVTGSGDHARIEHRVPSPKCNFEHSLYAILLAFSRYNENDDFAKYPRIYGNAFDDIYKLEEFLEYKDIEKNFYQGRVCHNSLLLLQKCNN